jgi:hypothetical protein
MSDKPKRVYHDYLIKNKIVPWTSWRTTLRRIKEDGFPAYQITDEKWCFDLEEVELWFKQHKKTA